VLLHGTLGDPAVFLHGLWWSALLFGVGVVTFARLEPRFAERV
jgi:hypothetical protein